LVRALPCHGRGYGFEPRRSRQSSFGAPAEKEGCGAETCLRVYVGHGCSWTSAPNYDSASQSMEYSYVYILQSKTCPERYYVGLTDDLKDRLKRHNAGEMIHTSKWRPWRIKSAIAFNERQRAADFERYLKTASGRAFAKKRL
jgi:putative endonuclease